MKSDVLNLLKSAVEYSRSGQSEKAFRITRQVVTMDPRNEQAWMLLAYLAPSTEERRAMLWKVLTINPQHSKAKEEFLKLVTPAAIQRAARKGVFISYAHSDEMFVCELTDNLRSLGVPVWMDLVDMPDGADWHRAVNNALEHCGLMLVMASPAAVHAENVRNELRTFMSAGKIALPVMLEPCDLDALSLWNQPVDFGKDYQVGLIRLVSLLAVVSARA